VAEVALNWSETTVEGGELNVPLEGEIPDGWAEHFETTVKLLGTGQWGTVELKKKKQSVHVDGVSPGDEDDVRFYLEGVVDQANSAHEAEQEQEQEEGHEDGDEGDGQKEPQGQDAEMTERFRAFAEDAEEEEEAR
jgi:hypothetical protein